MKGHMIWPNSGHCSAPAVTWIKFEPAWDHLHLQLPFAYQLLSAAPATWPCPSPQLCLPHCLPLLNQLGPLLCHLLSHQCSWVFSLPWPQSLFAWQPASSFAARTKEESMKEGCAKYVVIYVAAISRQQRQLVAVDWQTAKRAEMWGSWGEFKRKQSLPY